MNKELICAQTLLCGSGISLLDAARLIRNALDALPKNSTLTPFQFCAKVVETGMRHVRIKEMPIRDAFAAYLETKRDLRPDSLRDIRYLGKRLLRSNPDIAGRNFSEVAPCDCEAWLAAAFSTPSQFNKGRAMLHGFFQFALRRQWCEKNPVSAIARRKIVEREIKPLTLAETARLLKNSQSDGDGECSAAAGLLILAGIRPREVRRMQWRDIDVCERTITIRSLCSKTGGTRQVEMCPALEGLLRRAKRRGQKVCPPGWNRRWKSIRDESGFAGAWVQDVLRHTYASYKIFSRPPEAPAQYGAPQSKPAAFALRQHVRNFRKRRKKLFQPPRIPALNRTPANGTRR